ncbi:HET-domain-containing protein, partial [Ophiobolus disseminans]
MSQLLAERHSSNALHISASIEPTNDFQHQPLDTTKQEVRLVKLHRAAADEHTHVFCDVRTFEIATAPPYVALSYTWGPPEPKRVIFIGDKSYEVRENLYNFLYAFRSEESNTEYIYIDQLCIDQGSPDERNHQVRLMAPIYTQCTFVI